jgi:asparagine synthase (glutamine-hydrolysing)
MSGICGWVGEADPATLDAMLDAIDYRGDRIDKAFASGVALGYRWWGGRPGKSPGIHRDGQHLVACAGTFAPPTDSPAAALPGKLNAGADGLADLDGAFAAAWWDGDARRLTLLRDPFGVRSLYYAEHQGVFYFASEIKQLLAIPGFPRAVDDAAIHKYLTFSFVPGEDAPLKGVRRLLPRRVATYENRRLAITQYFELREALDGTLTDRGEAARLIGDLCKAAVVKRLQGAENIGLFLSGGLDSSSVALWLKEAGANVNAFTLDFGDKSVEKDRAIEVANALKIPLHFVKVGGEDLLPVLPDLAWRLDLPFGDAVTGPQYLLGKAARAAGCDCIFNGEGGDQLFGGWTQKPMIGAELYANLYANDGGEDSREETYLRSYHRFYGAEDALYTPAFRARVGPAGQRRALLLPYLHGEKANTFANHVRLADFALKGCQNILPRAERMANAWGLDVRTPLFDRKLAEVSFALAPQLKLHGAVEKFVLKLAVRGKLPREVVWRKKLGMGVPITDWTLGPLAPAMRELLGKASLERRGLFRYEYVEPLLQGRNLPGETRRRRVGERLWALAMLEAWLRVFIDGGGKKPGGDWR